MLKKLCSFCMVVALIMGLCACGNVDTQTELSNVANYEGTTLELLDATVCASEDGKTVIKVQAVYQNDNAEALYAYCSFSVKAYQNGVELLDVSDINGNEAVLIQEVKDGASLQVCYVFELSDTSDVEVNICTPTADALVKAKKVYSSFAGEWKANKVVSKTADSVEVETYVIKLNEDGTGSYQDKQGTWEYNKESNQIVLTLTAESTGMVLEIGQENGKSTLSFFEDVYYRASDFRLMGFESAE